MIAHSGVAEHAAFVGVVVAAIVAYGVMWDASLDGALRRFAAWVGAGVALVASTAPSMEAAAERSFTGHMVQHLVMIAVAAPLLASAEPVAVARRALRRSGRRVRVSDGERRLARRWRAVGPLVAPVVFVGVLFVTHLTSIYDRALETRIVHDVEHLAYLGSGVLLWSVIRGAGQADAVRRIGTVFAVIAGSALLGVVLISANAPLVATYEQRLGPAEALADQRAAASLMWVGGMATSLPLLILAFWRWATAEEAVARRSEQLTDAGIAGR